MFVLLKPIKTKKRRKTYPKVHDIGVIKYLTLDLPFKRNEPDFKGLSKGVKYLIPKGVLVPTFIDKYGSEKWAEHLTKIKFFKTVKSTKCNVVVFDNNGSLLDLLKKTVPYAKNTAVFTKNIPLYERFRDFCFSEYGCPIRINNYAGINSGVTFGENALNDSQFKRVTLSENDVKIPHGIDLKLERPVSKIDLSEALYLNSNIKNSDIFI